MSEAVGFSLAVGLVSALAVAVGGVWLYFVPQERRQRYLGEPESRARARRLALPAVVTGLVAVAGNPIARTSPAPPRSFAAWVVVGFAFIGTAFVGLMVWAKFMKWLLGSGWWLRAPSPGRVLPEGPRRVRRAYAGGLIAVIIVTALVLELARDRVVF